MSCVKGCVHSVVRDGAGRLGFRAGADGHFARLLDAPKEWRQAYADMVARLSLPSAPTLEFFDTLHGVGGMFIPGDWAIAIGIADAKAITELLFTQHAAELVAYAKSLGAQRQVTVAHPYNVILGGVVGRIMAHELGHAVLFCGGVNPEGDEEAGADYYAARIDAARGKDEGLGVAIFHSIGCTGSSCTHPSPEVRAGAYVHGYRDQRAA